VFLTQVRRYTLQEHQHTVSYISQRLQYVPVSTKITDSKFTSNTTHRNRFLHQGPSCISSHADAGVCLADIFHSLTRRLCVVHVEVYVQNHGEHHKHCSRNKHSFAQRLASPVTRIYHISVLGVVGILCCSSDQAGLRNCKCNPAEMSKIILW
jgi:hypothetical protein